MTKIFIDAANTKEIIDASIRTPEDVVSIALSGDNISAVPY